MLGHEEAALVHELGRVEIGGRVAFAATCAERIFPGYLRFCERSGRGNAEVMSMLLERVWRHLLGDTLGSEERRLHLRTCLQLVPGEDDEPWIFEQAYGDDAASAVAYAIRATKSGSPQDVAWAAGRAIESTEYYVMHRLGIRGVEPVQSHPLVRQEYNRQRRDLDELGAVQSVPRELILWLRDRARQETPTFLCPA